MAIQEAQWRLSGGPPVPGGHSVSAPNSKRAYGRAVDNFLAWHQQEHPPAGLSTGIRAGRPFRDWPRSKGGCGRFLLTRRGDHSGTRSAPAAAAVRRSPALSWCWGLRAVASHPWSAQVYCRRLPSTGAPASSSSRSGRWSRHTLKLPNHWRTSSINRAATAIGRIFIASSSELRNLTVNYTARSCARTPISSWSSAIF